jgi:protein phosphatase
MHLRNAALTDIGRIRRTNEDRVLRDEALALYGVADGIGGLPGGAEAAQCAIDAVHYAIKNARGEPDLAQVTIEANTAVAQLGQRFSPHFGIGTTLTWGLFRRGQLHLAHVGELIWINEQHRNALTRCVGQNTPLDVDVSVRDLQAGDRYLFCSDGITRMIREAELAEFLLAKAEPAKILRDMVDTANLRGGLDNLTCVLVVIDSLK